MGSDSIITNTPFVLRVAGGYTLLALAHSRQYAGSPEFRVAEVRIMSSSISGDSAYTPAADITINDADALRALRDAIDCALGEVSRG